MRQGRRQRRLRGQSFSWAPPLRARTAGTIGCSTTSWTCCTTRVGVDLATAPPPTASPPPWLRSPAHSGVLPVTDRGETLWPGARRTGARLTGLPRARPAPWSASCAGPASRHPALVGLANVNNDLGCHNVYDYSDGAARASVWLRGRSRHPGTPSTSLGHGVLVAALQPLGADLPPRLAASHPNPTQHSTFKALLVTPSRTTCERLAEILRELYARRPRHHQLPWCSPHQRQ
ncbi:beta-galactosidase [Streptomyces mutabilis]|uniref:beta-galactosidase n=1 Tax=Streptomyces mutabilis TaxID=67332 RepID=UPI0035EF6236